MKTPNNNKRIINKLVINYLKANKNRNYFAIIGIVLTCIMFTGIVTSVLTMTGALEQQMVATTGGDIHGTIKEVDFETAELFQEHKSIKDSYLSIGINVFNEGKFERLPTELKYIPFGSVYYKNINSYTGSPATKYNEIVISPNVLKLLGKPLNIGEVITLNFTIIDETFTEDFVVTGITEDNPLIDVGFIYVSETFMEEHIKNNDKMTFEFLRSAENEDYRIDLEINFKNKRNIMGKLEKVIQDTGFIPFDEVSYDYELRYDTNYFRYNANPIYRSNMDMDLISVVAVLLSCLLITISGYLIINNIFTISVLRDINYYGQLKTIGATAKQIKQIIVRQAIFLSFIGIPIGLILGLVVGNIMSTFILNGADGINVPIVVNNFDYRIYVSSIIFVMFTVYISLIKPSKIVANLSPIEALRYTNESNNIKLNKKINHNKKVSAFTFAIRNLKSQRFTTLKVIFSIALGPIILNGVYSFSDGYLNEEAYVHSMSPSDFMIGSNKYFNSRFHGGSGRLSEESVNFVKNIEMIDEDEQGAIYIFSYDEEYGFAIANIENNLENVEISDLFGMGEFSLSKYDVVIGEIDYEKYMSGDYIVYIGSFDDNNEYISKEKYPDVNHLYPGEKVSLTIGNIEKEYEIMAVVNSNYALGIRYTMRGAPNDKFILPVDELKGLNESIYLMTYLFDVEDEYLYDVESIMKDYKETNTEGTRYVSKIDIMESAKSAKDVVMLPGIIISVVIGIISIVNFINLIIASIIARGKEFAIMESIGMTKAMKKNIILYEGLLYALFASMIFVILGVIVDITLIQSMTSIVAYPNYSFSIVLLLSCVPLCFVILPAITMGIYKLNNKSSVIEKLRAE